MHYKNTSSSSVAMAKSSSTFNKNTDPSMEILRFKLARIVSHHQQMKLSFHHLKSQIQSGLLEAEDVFASLAVPLVKLVGLKTGQMAEEGRFSTFVTKKGVSVEETMPAESQYKEDNYVSKATLAGKELTQKHVLQMTQLIRLLKQIENQVNSSHNDIFQTISDHRDSVQGFFQKMMAMLAAIHQGRAGPNYDTMVIIVKLLRATFERVNVAFDSVERGVENLIYNLGDQMCDPMMQYVKSLKMEMSTGPFLKLLAIVEKMGGELRIRQMKLEEERKKAREVEERKLEALSMLKKSEESIQKMKDYMSSTVATRSNCIKYSATHKLKGVGHDSATDEMLLWELLNKKRKYQNSDSPLGPQELCIGFNHYNHKSKRVTPQISSRPISRNYSRALTPDTSCLDSRLILGSSPSVVPQKVMARKRTAP